MIAPLMALKHVVAPLMEAVGNCMADVPQLCQVRRNISVTSTTISPNQRHDRGIREMLTTAIR
jgi:hypothetical protein